MKTNPTVYLNLRLTYYEAMCYWLAAQSVLVDTTRAEAVLGKAAPGRSPVAAARRAHVKLGAELDQLLQKPVE
jgi:hypothetical protein